MGWQDYAREPSRLPAKLVRMAQNAALDLRFGLRASGSIPSPFESEGAYVTVSTQVSALSRLFDPSHFLINSDDVLVDVGCGQGRVIAYWLSRGFTNAIIGIEFNEQVAAETRTRLGLFENVTIVAGNIVDVLPPAGTVFFLYNPFDLRMMRGFRDALIRDTRRAPRLRLVYYNPTEIVAFEEDGRWEIERFPKSPDLLFGAAYIRLKETEPATARPS